MQALHSDRSCQPFFGDKSVHTPRCTRGSYYSLHCGHGYRTTTARKIFCPRRTAPCTKRRSSLSTDTPRSGEGFIYTVALLLSWPFSVGVVSHVTFEPGALGRGPQKMAKHVLIFTPHLTSYARGRERTANSGSRVGSCPLRHPAHYFQRVDVMRRYFDKKHPAIQSNTEPPTSKGALE